MNQDERRLSMLLRRCRAHEPVYLNRPIGMIFFQSIYELDGIIRAYQRETSKAP